jgi:hypothetical protein
MARLLLRLRYLFLGLFALGAGAAWTYQLVWVEPAKRCEAAHHWWDGSTRTCAIPISVSNFTHRPIPSDAPKP